MTRGLRVTLVTLLRLVIFNLVYFSFCGYPIILIYSSIYFPECGLVLGAGGLISGGTERVKKILITQVSFLFLSTIGLV